MVERGDMVAGGCGELGGVSAGDGGDWVLAGLYGVVVGRSEEGAGGGGLSRRSAATRPARMATRARLLVRRWRRPADVASWIAALTARRWVCRAVIMAAGAAVG
jgi:hypothetical protein